jgi:multidrug resistance efflux pump
VNVGSLAGGRVTRVLVDEGSPVTAGQLIVQLETETIDRQIAEQQAAIQASQANLAKAVNGPRPEEISKAAATAANDERGRAHQLTLFHYGIISRQLYDDAATKAKTSAARAQTEEQKRHLAELLKQRSETDVKSTVNGVVQSFGLRPGDIVAPNQSVAEILESDQLWVRVFIPETMLGLVKGGMPVKVRTDTYPNEWFAGHVATVSSQGEFTPRNVQTRAQRSEQVFGVKVIVDPNARLHAGMAAEVDFGVRGKAE